MIFKESPLRGVWLIDLERREDDRGFFARFFCEREFESKGLASGFVQVNNSLSLKKGTLRGMHYQLPPHQEVKVVRCIAGSLWDVVLDVRPGSPTFGRWFGAELSARNRTMMYVPRGFAHGFFTLEDDTEALYLVSEFYTPNVERCIRWNDPQFKIEWPGPPVVISQKDRAEPDFGPGRLAELELKA
ncbi:MAG: dTDP-4-dehydrorhamnose 3,5-epimerase [Deltaproteobacteria bacterium]|nr:dTDP-4-dehydrorhamnose 3,5-epimerase [Deltaproteobacteria bacterium]